ncbi:hypothetical protein [Alicyclobacillus sp. SP_1]|uniref:hypothetical protein n=1 Tax=Alicyclobacillus sp. SP_1 TaxID=2942475 RepID=UPI002158647C|nr:hypothetical protein [Alicyclobacillus sp. SP_1]
MERNTDEEKLKSLFADAADVPFPETLKAKILEQAKAQLESTMKRDHSEKKSTHRPSEARSRRWWQRTRTLISSGIAVAVVLVVAGAIWSHTSKTGVEKVGPASSSMASSTASNGLMQAPLRPPFGLIPSALRVNRLWTGASNGWPSGSVVFASVTNTSAETLTRHDVFGVLSFSGANSGLTHDDFMSFVNGPRVIAPGATVTWSFHPVGAPANASGALIQSPHLVFYQARLTSSATAPVVWRGTDVRATNVFVHPGEAVAVGQAVTVDVMLQNDSSSSVPLSHLVALIWFSNEPGTSFVSDKTERFMDNIYSPVATSIAPHQSLEVSFHVIGGKSSDYFSMVPHVVVIQTP